MRPLLSIPQASVYRAIRSWEGANQTGPRLIDIATLASKSVTETHRLVNFLVRKGWAKRDPGVPRSLRTVREMRVFYAPTRKLLVVSEDIEAATFAIGSYHLDEVSIDVPGVYDLTEPLLPL